MPKIHPTAIIRPPVELAEDVEVGPYAIVGPEVQIGPGTVIGPFARVEFAKIGSGNKILHGAVIGLEPQDLKFKGEASWVRIGDRNVIREFVTIHRGTGEGTETVVGNDCYLMAYSHLGHNVRLGNGVIIVNSAQLGGHAVVEDYAYISAFVPVHQFARVGKLAIVSGATRVSQDIPPFMMAEGYEARIVGVNRVGLRRRGYSSERIDRIAEAYRILYRQGRAFPAALEVLEERFGDDPDIRHLIQFIKSTKRGVTRRA